MVWWKGAKRINEQDNSRYDQLHEMNNKSDMEAHWWMEGRHIVEGGQGRATGENDV